jgi:hypothetical protein
MPTIADYKIVLDGTAVIQRGTGQGFNFTRHNFALPGNIVPEQSGILMCRIEAEEADGLKYTLTINDVDLLTLTHSEDRFGTIHEVIGANVLRFGDNQFRAVASDGEGALKISDVVVYFQATV